MGFPQERVPILETIIPRDCLLFNNLQFATVSSRNSLCISHYMPLLSHFLRSRNLGPFHRTNVNKTPFLSAEFGYSPCISLSLLNLSLSL
jgi:hypothetical protein